MWSARPWPTREWGKTPRHESASEAMRGCREIMHRTEPPETLAQNGPLLILADEGVSKAFRVSNDRVCSKMGQVLNLVFHRTACLQCLNAYGSAETCTSLV